ncbi:NmrA-type/Isoflavone reductase-like domain-containing protein [Pleurotus pulmonarius]
MSTYTSFAVVGAGDMGSRILTALIAKGVKAVALTRAIPSPRKTFPVGAAVEEVDYTSVENISAALQKHQVEVVISTLTWSGFDAQTRVGDAAKAAGVKLFVPSEFGMPSKGAAEGLLGLKQAFVDHLESIRLPYTRFFVGLWASQATWLTDFVTNGKVNHVARGDSVISFTAEDDIAGIFVAHVLTSLPAAALENKDLRIQGDRITLDDLAALLKTELFDAGLGSTGWDVEAGKELDGDQRAGASNELWAGHQWKSVKEALGI